MQLQQPILISIHAPRVGSDYVTVEGRFTIVIFLSTLPAWGATLGRAVEDYISSYFYPRSPRGERQ